MRDSRGGAARRRRRKEKQAVLVDFRSSMQPRERKSPTPSPSPHTHTRARARARKTSENKVKVERKLLFFLSLSLSLSLSLRLGLPIFPSLFPSLWVLRGEASTQETQKAKAERKPPRSPYSRDLLPHPALSFTLIYSPPIIPFREGRGRVSQFFFSLSLSRLF